MPQRKSSLSAMLFRWLAATFLVAGVSSGQQGPRSVKETVDWADLGERLLGKRVHIGMADASLVSGKVVQVDDHEIAIESERKRKAVERGRVKFLQYDEYRGRARAGWSTGLAFGAVGLFALLGAREVWGEDGPRHPVPVAGAFAVGGAAAGYGIGRARDRTTVVLTIRQ